MSENHMFGAEDSDKPQEWVRYNRNHFYGDLRTLVRFFDGDPSFSIPASEHIRVHKQMEVLAELFAKYMGH